MEQDSPWKDIIEALFPEFLAFFFPQIYQDIDFSRGFEFLDKELQQILKDSETGKRIVDKLVKVYLKSGDEKWLLIHVEVQGAAERHFAKRIYIYNYRIFDKFNRDVISLAILADNQPHFRENEHRLERWGFRLQMSFPIIKLIDYASDWETLDRSPNPFARAVKAFLKTLETEKNNQTRFRWKRQFLLNLYDSGFTREKIVALYRFIDWIMALPGEMEERILSEAIAKEKGSKMPYITYAERRGIAIGEKKGEETGVIIGERKGIYQNIYDILEIKFGDEGLTLFESVKKVDNINFLQAIRNGLKAAQNIADAKKVITEQIQKFEAEKSSSEEN